MTWVAVGTAAAIGAGVGAGSGILQGEDTDTILKKALIGGATGAVTGGIGAEATAATEVGMGLGEELTQEGIKAASDEAMKEALAQEAINPLTEIGNGINPVSASEKIIPEIINGTAQIGPPPPAGIEQIAPAAPSPVAGAPTGINQFSSAELNAINQGQADAMMAQGTGTQVAGPAMNVTPTPPSTPTPEPDLVNNSRGITYKGQPTASSQFVRNMSDFQVGNYVPGDFANAGNPAYLSTLGQVQPNVMAPIPSPAPTPPSSNPFMEGFASVKNFVKSNPLESAVIGYAGLSALDSFSPKQDPRKKKTYVNNYPISPNFQPSRPQPNVYQSRYAEGGITSFDDEAGVDQFAPGGSVRKERDSDADFKRYYSMMNARPEIEADEEALRKPRIAKDDDPETRYQDALTAALTRQNKNYARANISFPPVKRPTPLGTINLAPLGTQQAASGGIMGYDLGGYAAGGNPRLLKGPGDGMSDNIPAVIGRKQPARLADGEFVVPADVVSHLGNGSTDAGAKKLHQMMDKVRTDRTGKKRQAPEVNADKYLPGNKKASGGIASITGYAKGGITRFDEGGSTNDSGGVYADASFSDAQVASYLANNNVTTPADVSAIQSAFGVSSDQIARAQALNAANDASVGQATAAYNAAIAANPAQEAQNARDLVTQMYSQQLGRAPDAEGLNYWATQIAQGASPQSVAQAINRSLEGTNYDTQAIESAYNRTLGRTAEQEGFQFWLSNAQANSLTQKQLMDAITAAAEAKEKVDRGIQGKTFTQLEVADLVADPFGGRRATTSIYDVPKNEADRINISYINGIPVQFVNPVTEKALISKYGEGTYKASMGEETYSPARVSEAADRAFRAGSMTKVEYDKVMTGLNGINKDIQTGKLNASTAGDSIRTLLNVPKGFKIVDPTYGQQIGEDNALDKALAEAAKRQDVLAKQDPGYYQANDILGLAYKNAGLDFPFMSSDYKANTMMTQADKLTPQNVKTKLNETTNQLRQNGPYKPYQVNYDTINQNRTPLPVSTRDPYSDEGLSFLYGQMMDQYSTRDPNRINPATISSFAPVQYKPPVSTTLQKEIDARAVYDAKVAADRAIYDKAPLTAENFDEKDYITRYPDAFQDAPGRPYQHYLEANANGDIRTANKLPFTPTPYAPTPLIATTPAPATPATPAAPYAPSGDRAGGLMSIKHKKRKK